MILSRQNRNLAQILPSNFILSLTNVCACSAAFFLFDEEKNPYLESRIFTVLSGLIFSYLYPQTLVLSQFYFFLSPIFSFCFTIFQNFFSEFVFHFLHFYASALDVLVTRTYTKLKQTPTQRGRKFSAFPIEAAELCNTNTTLPSGKKRWWRKTLI